LVPEATNRTARRLPSARDLAEQIQLRHYPATLEPCDRWLLRADARRELPLADLLPLAEIADEPRHLEAVELDRELGILLALLPDELVQGPPDVAVPLPPRPACHVPLRCPLGLLEALSRFR